MRLVLVTLLLLLTIKSFSYDYYLTADYKISTVIYTPLIYDRWFYPDGCNNYCQITEPTNKNIQKASEYGLNPKEFHFEENISLQYYFDPSGNELHFGSDRIDGLFYKGILVSFIVVRGEQAGQSFVWDIDANWYRNEYRQDYEMWWAGYVLRSVYATSSSIQALGYKETWLNLPRSILAIPGGINAWFSQFGNAGIQRKVGMLYNLHLSFNTGGFKYISVLGLPATIIPRPINSQGIAYPRIIVEGLGEVPFPQGPFPKTNPKALRSKFTTAYKASFKKWWTETQGRPWPKPQSGEFVSIHHIKPLSRGGTNSFENLVPLIEQTQHIHFTRWWSTFE